MTWPKGLRVDSEDAPGGWWGTVWPVGALFFSTMNENPADSLGFGTWEPYGVSSLLLNGPAMTVNSVTSAPSSVKTQAIPTAPIFVWQRVS